MLISQFDGQVIIPCPTCKNNNKWQLISTGHQHPQTPPLSTAIHSHTHRPSTTKQFVEQKNEEIYLITFN